MSELNIKNIPMDWDDKIKSNYKQSTLEEGDYPFEVVDFERGFFAGSEKMAACNKAMITLQIQAEENTVEVRTTILLNRMCEGRIVAFFSSIGRIKVGESISMNWDGLIGSKGRAHIKPDTFMGSDGKEHNSYNVTFLYSEEDDDDLPF